MELLLEISLTTIEVNFLSVLSLLSTFNYLLTFGALNLQGIREVLPDLKCLIKLVDDRPSILAQS